jgi:hypothetical protein
VGGAVPMLLHVVPPPEPIGWVLAGMSGDGARDVPGLLSNLRSVIALQRSLKKKKVC